MTNNDIDTTITYQTNKDGRLSKRGQAKALADLATIKATAEELLAAILVKADAGVELTEAECDEANGYHDAIRAIECEVREVEINRAPMSSYTDWLIFNNID